MKDRDDELSQLLQAWQPLPHCVDDIRAGVWRQIAREESATPWWMQTLAVWFERSAVAATVVGLAVATGLVMGMAIAADAQMEAYLDTVSIFRQL